MNKTLKELKVEWEAVDTEFAALDKEWQKTERRWGVAWRAYRSALEKMEQTRNKTLAELRAEWQAAQAVADAAQTAAYQSKYNTGWKAWVVRQAAWTAAGKAVVDATKGATAARKAYQTALEKEQQT